MLVVDEEVDAGRDVPVPRVRVRKVTVTVPLSKATTDRTHLRFNCDWF